MTHELEHGLLELVLAHLAVTHADACGRNELLEVGGASPDGVDAVVQEIDLAATS